MFCIYFLTRLLLIFVFFSITSYALKMWSSWHFSCYKFPNYHQHHSLLHCVENIIPLVFMFSNTFGNWRNHLEISRTPSRHSLTFVQYAVLIFDHIVRNQCILDLHRLHAHVQNISNLIFQVKKSIFSKQNK